jgi:hypothetical protein
MLDAIIGVRSTPHAIIQTHCNHVNEFIQYQNTKLYNLMYNFNDFCEIGEFYKNVGGNGA